MHKRVLSVVHFEIRLYELVHIVESWFVDWRGRVIAWIVRVGDQTGQGEPAGTDLEYAEEGGAGGKAWEPKSPQVSASQRENKRDSWNLPRYPSPSGSIDNDAVPSPAFLADLARSFHSYPAAVFGCFSGRRLAGVGSG